MTMFAALVSEDINFHILSSYDRKEEKFKNIVFNKFAGFIDLDVSELHNLPKDSSDCFYIDDVQCVNTHTGLKTDVVLKIVGLDSVSEQYDPFRYLNINQYGFLIGGDNYFSKNKLTAFNLYLPSKKQYILNKEWEEKINDFSQDLYLPFKKMVDQHYVLLKNVKEIESCELSHNDIFDLKTNAIIIKENSDQIFKFEKLLSTFSMLCSEFNGNGFSGSVELSLKDCGKLFNIGQYFKI